MKLLLGSNLKNLRKEKDITQEELAEILGVSYQSVSRWENGSCYPDMELLPTIAGFFETTVDKLLGVNEEVEQQEVERYLEEYQKAVSLGNVKECIRIAREGVAEYPNNYVLLNKLMNALFLSGGDDGNIPDWKENQEKYDEEIIRLGERIRKYCPEQNIRLEAVWRLAFQHCVMGRKEIGRAIFETLPPFEWCKEYRIWYGLKEEEKLPFLREQMFRFYCALSDALYNLSREKLLPDEERLQVFEKQAALDTLMWDGNVPDFTWISANDHCKLAEVYALLGRQEEAIRHLRIGAGNAYNYDVRQEVEERTSFLFGTRTFERIKNETYDTRSLCKIMRDTWMSSKDFDGIRDKKEFQEIMDTLEKQNEKFV